MSEHAASQSDRELASPIRLIVADVDGVFTDGGLWIDAAGREFKRFDVQDGLGVRLWIEAGFEWLAVTGRGGTAVRHRLGELGVRWIVSGVADKEAAVESMLPRLGVRWSEIAVIGDDLPELPLFRRAGLGVAVANAATDVLQAARWVTRSTGGHGAVRELVERLLRATDRWAVADGSTGGAG